MTNAFGIEHEPLAKAWAGSSRASKKALTLLHNGRLVARDGDRAWPKSKSFNKNVIDAVTTHRVRSTSRTINPENDPDAVAGVMRAGKPSYKQRTGKKRRWDKDINGFDHRAETPSKRWVSDDPNYRQYRGKQR